MNKKPLLAVTMVFLLAGVTILPVSAQVIQTEKIASQETTLVDSFIDDVERIASESISFSDFAQRLRNHLLDADYSSCPVVNEIYVKILQYLLSKKPLSIGSLGIFNLLSKSTTRFGSNFFVISYGAYHRLNPRKENSVDLIKERLSMWRYSDTARLLKGRTLIFERHPFGIHQRMTGPQLGIMKGFKGIYLDIESKLTGNSYVFFLGGVRRIHAFDLPPFSK
jgi:hypothetical protein